MWECDDRELVVVSGKVGSLVWVGKQMKKWTDSARLYLSPVLPDNSAVKISSQLLFSKILPHFPVPGNDLLQRTTLPKILNKPGSLVFLMTLIRFTDNCLVYPVTAKHSPFFFCLNFLNGLRQTFHFLFFVLWMISWD